MTRPLMSDAEIRRRKKIQGHVSNATGALGLTALGGTLLASRGGRHTLRKIPKLKSKIAAPPPKDPNRDRIKGAVTPILATAAGIGGASSFNFAAYTNAEARKKGPRVVAQPKKKKVAKSDPFNVKKYDPERKRAKRNANYQRGAEATSLAAGAGAAGYGAKAVGDTAAANFKVRRSPVKGLNSRFGGTKKQTTVEMPWKAGALARDKFKSVQTGKLKPLQMEKKKIGVTGLHRPAVKLGNTGKAGVLGATAVGAGLAASKINDKRKPGGSWS